MSYEKRTKASGRLFERAKKVIPGGICHNLRYFAPYPFYVDRARGAYVWDVDGNRYIDFWMGHYAHILGHRDEEVVEKVSSCIRERGYHFGLVNRDEVKLAELVVELVPSAEQVRFCSSGTEAAMYAVRLARAYTGKRVVLKVAGGWHGASTDLSFGVSCPFDEQETLGLPEGVEKQVRLIPFNDWEGTLKVIDEVGEDVACAIVEPVVGVGGFIPASRKYLLNLKEELESRGAILIFDEVITGFRISLGGYQKVVGVYPHLTVLGKVLGGGFPIGAVAGKREILELGSWERKKSERVLVGGGTFSCNPVSMVAGITVLERLKDMEGEVYPKIDSLGEMLRKGVEEIGREFGVPVVTTGFGSLFAVHVLKEEGRSLRSPEDVCTYTYWEMRDKEFRRFLAQNGVCMIHAGGAVSYAHKEDDVESTLFVVRRFFEGWKR